MSHEVIVVWPDGPRFVDADEILSWARDSYENNADVRLCNRCGDDCMHDNGPDGCQHDAGWAPVYIDEVEDPSLDLEAAMFWLADMGEATFARRHI